LIHFYKSLDGLVMTDLLEVGRRLKRSFDGYITYRKMAGILLLLLFFFLYLGPGIMAWLTGRDRGSHVTPLQACLTDKLARWSRQTAGYNAHNHSSPNIAYVGNGYIGMSVTPNSEINIKSRRTLSVPVQYKPLVHLSLEGEGREEVGLVTDYVRGTVTQVQCLAERGGSEEAVTVTSNVWLTGLCLGCLSRSSGCTTPPARPCSWGWRSWVLPSGTRPSPSPG